MEILLISHRLRQGSPFPRLPLTDGVTGNTSDFGSEESRFEPWSVNKDEQNPARAGFFICTQTEQGEKFIPHGTLPGCGKPWSVNKDERNPARAGFFICTLWEQGGKIIPICGGHDQVTAALWSRAGSCLSIAESTR